MPLVEAPSRLNLALQRLPEDVFEPGYVAEAPLVRFVAYLDDARLFGWVRLQADRLTDLLNTHDELLLADGEIESLVDGSTRASDELLVRRADLIAVHANGPRGDESRRLATRVHPLVLQSGSFLIGGHLHAPVGANPIVDFARRPPMVPLTGAWIEFWTGGRRRRQWTGTLVVNRDRAHAIRPVSADELAEGVIRPVEPAGHAAR